MRILVTGGAGFIGSNFVRRVLGGAYPALAEAHVVVYDALTYSGTVANLRTVTGDPRLTFVHGDILDAERLAAAITGCDIVVHFAAESHVDRSVLDSLVCATTNVVGTTRLLEESLRAGVQKFVHVSTDEVYGSIAAGSWREDHVLEPNSPYAASKAGSDMMVRAYHRTHGLPTVITRCSNNYGPYQFPEKVMPLFITNLLDGLTVPLYGTGENVRDWLHVDDHCDGIALVLEGGRPGEIYNIGGGTELTNTELTELILQATGRDWSSVEHVPDRLGHDLRYSVDHTKITDELGYRPRIAFDDGLSAVVEWYAANRDWWEPLKHRADPVRR